MKRTSHAGRLKHHAAIALEEPAFAVLTAHAELAEWPTVGDPRLAARLTPLVSLLRRDANPHLNKRRPGLPNAWRPRDQFSRTPVNGRDLVMGYRELTQRV